MFMNMKYSILAAGLIGGATLATGALPASATSLAPAALHWGQEAGVEQVRHWWGHRPGRVQGERYFEQKNVPQDHRSLGYGFGGPSTGFDLDFRGGQRSYGLSVPRGQPGAEAPGINRRYGRISR